LVLRALLLSGGKRGKREKKGERKGTGGTPLSQIPGSAPDAYANVVELSLL